MQLPERPDDKQLANRKGARASIAVRIDRAAGDLNPLLIMLTIGLMVLDLTLYVGMSVSREAFMGRAARQIAAPVTPGTVRAAEPADFSR